jgi:hypothetical protein
VGSHIETLALSVPPNPNSLTFVIGKFKAWHLQLGMSLFIELLAFLEPPNQNIVISKLVTDTRFKFGLAQLEYCKGRNSCGKSSLCRILCCPVTEFPTLNYFITLLENKYPTVLVPLICGCTEFFGKD